MSMNEPLEHRKADEADGRAEGGERPSHVVGIGASAGGLEALTAFFENMPSKSGVAFVVIQHLSPDYKSLMVELLSKCTSMRVLRAEEGMPVFADTVFLIPPGKNLQILNRQLLLTDVAPTHGPNLPIDLFFQSLAGDQGEKAIGIILSGTGSDGTRGVRAIKEAGGMVMVQDEMSAKFDGMPRSAIATGLADYILPPAEMPEELMNFILHPFAKRRRRAETVGDAEDSEDSLLTKIFSLIRRQTDVDFSHYRPNTVNRRIERRLSVNQMDNLQMYVRFLRENPREVHVLFKEILIGVTGFFRDPKAYDVVRHKVLPETFEKRRGDLLIRAWVVGCSTGEEAYSLAMLLDERMEEEKRAYDIKVFATDIDKEAIDFASNGVYPESIAADIDPRRIERHFVRKGDRYQVVRRLREMVVFAQHNIIKDPPFAKIDFLSCRNLLIYMQPVLQRKVLSLFHFALNPQGFLMLGSSETVGELGHSFDAFDKRWKIYRKTGSGRDTLADTLSLVARSRNVSFRGHARPEGAVPDSSTRMDEVYESLLADYVPPCVILNEDREIVHVFGKLDRYLRIPTGRFQSDLLKLAHADLALPLTAALNRSAKEPEEVRYNHVALRFEGETVYVSLRVKRFPERKRMAGKTAVFIEPAERREPMAAADVSSVPLDEAYHQRISDLERDLQFSRESLQATVEELEASNEELQATNEELLASNEELQSTNEELQSVNEELYTVNSEYENKIHELTVLNDDMENFINNSTHGTLFLDRELKIRRLTPKVSELLNILPRDVGRPLDHFAGALRDMDLVEELRSFWESHIPVEKEVETVRGKPLRMTITPFRSAEPKDSGIVLSFVDIGEIKGTEEALRRERDLLARIVETGHSALLIVDGEGRLTFVNKRARELFGRAGSSVQGRTLDQLKTVVTDEAGRPLPDEENLFQRVWSTGRAVLNASFHLRGREGEPKKVSGAAAPLREKDGRVFALVASLMETEEGKESWEGAPSKGVLEECPCQAVVGVDEEERIVYWGPGAGRVFGLEEDEAMGRDLCGAIVAEGFRSSLDEALGEARREGRWRGDMELRRGDGAGFSGLASIRRVPCGGDRGLFFMEIFLEGRSLDLLHLLASSESEEGS